MASIDRTFFQGAWRNEWMSVVFQVNVSEILSRLTFGQSEAVGSSLALYRGQVCLPGAWLCILTILCVWLGGQRYRLLVMKKPSPAVCYEGSHCTGRVSPEALYSIECLGQSIEAPAFIPLHQVSYHADFFLFLVQYCLLVSELMRPLI